MRLNDAERLVNSGIMNSSSSVSNGNAAPTVSVISCRLSRSLSKFINIDSLSAGCFMRSAFCIMPSSEPNSFISRAAVF